MGNQSLVFAQVCDCSCHTSYANPFEGHCVWESASGGQSGPCCDAASCFLPGTKIAMADGTEKNIEDIKVGDMVKSFVIEGDATLVDDKGNKTKMGPTRPSDDYYEEVGGDGKTTMNVYDPRFQSGLKDINKDEDISTAKLNIFQKVKFKIKQKWEKIVDYFTPITKM